MDKTNIELDKRGYTMIKPTVGRMVWYYQNPLVYKGSLVKQRAAIICYVHDDGLINLSVFDEQGHSYPALGVQLVQEGEETPSNYYATWMPYQIGQAKKTEELMQQGDTSQWDKA